MKQAPVLIGTTSNTKALDSPMLIHGQLDEVRKIKLERLTELFHSHNHRDDSQ